MLLVIFPKLTTEEAEENIRKIEQWFSEHPKRKVCRTDLFKVRRGYVREDILEHTRKEAKCQP